MTSINNMVSPEAPKPRTPARLWDGYVKLLRILIFAMVFASGACILLMILATCADVILRAAGRPIIGVFDIVRIAGALTLALALPYTTAIKGHVAIEYFFHKLGKKTRLVVDSCLRLMSIALFIGLCRYSIVFGNQLRTTGQVTQTLQWPIFWIPWVIALSCAATAMVIFFHLARPGKEMIKP